MGSAEYNKFIEEISYQDDVAVTFAAHFLASVRKIESTVLAK